MVVSVLVIVVPLLIGVDAGRVVAVLVLLGSEGLMLPLVLIHGEQLSQVRCHTFCCGDLCTENVSAMMRSWSQRVRHRNQPRCRHRLPSVAGPSGYAHSSDK